MKLGLITTKEAEYIGSAASVAGGWIMAGGEWCNRTSTYDALLRLGGRVYADHRLACVPDVFDAALLPVEAATCAEIIRCDIARAETRNWAKGSIAGDVETLREWLARIEAVNA